MSTEEIKLRCLEVAKGQQSDVAEIIKDAEKLYRYVMGSGTPGENREVPVSLRFVLTDQEQ